MGNLLQWQVGAENMAGPRRLHALAWGEGRAGGAPDRLYHRRTPDLQHFHKKTTILKRGL
jgi:hypothetical protein